MIDIKYTEEAERVITLKRYSEERKAAVLRRMMPPENTPIPLLAEETGISGATLYTWRKQARVEGLAVPGDGKNPEQWSSEDKFAVVVETASMNAAELAEYCRQKGLYAEQIEAWARSCREANATAVERAQAQNAPVKAAHKKIRGLERELQRKEKALSEAAALLVLQKKARAIWGEDEDA